MSIIERSNPLNLEFRVCVVTSASTPLGVVICKTLLKANAFVLGVDTQPKDHSLNAGLGTHFQFENCDVNDADVPARIVATAKERYGLERLDVLVNIVDDGKEGDVAGLQRLSEEVAKVMGEAGKGSIINVIGNVAGVDEEKSKPAVDFTKDFASKHQKGGIRCNIVVPRATKEDDGESSKAYNDAKAHMTEMMKAAKNADGSKKAAPELYHVGNVTLFLAGDMGEKVSGASVGHDGSYHDL